MTWRDNMEDSTYERSPGWYRVVEFWMWRWPHSFPLPFSGLVRSQNCPLYWGGTWGGQKQSIQREQLKEVEGLEANRRKHWREKKDLRALRTKLLSNIWRVWRDCIFSEWPELVQWGPVTTGSCVVSCIQLFATPWTIAHQVPLSMGFPRLEYWSKLPFPSPGDLPDPRIEPVSLMPPVLAGRFFTTTAT